MASRSAAALSARLSMSRSAVRDDFLDDGPGHAFGHEGHGVARIAAHVDGLDMGLEAHPEQKRRLDGASSLLGARGGDQNLGDGHGVVLPIRGLHRPKAV